ncbi:fasciclin domain-containing protein [bacterium]|nr:fasciclin domain-containing protein [bacterium]
MRRSIKVFLVNLVIVLVTSLILNSALAQNKNVLDTLKGQKNCSVFLKAVEMAELTETLTGEGPVTVLVPTDDVAEDLKSAVDEGDTDKVYSIVSCHIISTEGLSANELAESGEVYTDGGTITVKKEGKDIIINDTIKITKADIKASNGIIHLINGVIMPAEEEAFEEETFEEESEEEEGND